jgi:predicted  nucleic acid-binding Zn-ribbon protein
MEIAKNQNRSFEKNKNINSVENKALKEEIDALMSKVKKLEYECQVKNSRTKTLETEVEALKKQSKGVPYG